MPAVPRSIASSASRYILLAGGAGGASIMFAGKVHSMTAPAPADGSRSINRIDRTEARRLVSGPFGIQTIPALLGALVCIGARARTPRPCMPRLAAPCWAAWRPTASSSGATRTRTDQYAGRRSIDGANAAGIRTGAAPRRVSGGRCCARLHGRRLAPDSRRETPARSRCRRSSGLHVAAHR